jgi:hypothetical protein
MIDKPGIAPAAEAAAAKRIKERRERPEAGTTSSKGQHDGSTLDECSLIGRPQEFGVMKQELTKMQASAPSVKAQRGLSSSCFDRGDNKQGARR